MTHRCNIYKNNQFFIAETLDYDAVYELLLSTNFPGVPKGKDEARYILKKAVILGFYKKVEGHLVGVLLLFDGCYVDIAMHESVQKRWATKQLCVACLKWLFNKSTQPFLKMVLHNDTSKILKFLGGQFEGWNACGFEIYRLEKSMINPHLLKKL